MSGLLLSVTAGPASAAPSCLGASCVHVDPGATNCGGSNGAFLESVTAPGGGATVTLRWSAYCRANWTRWAGGTSSPGYWDYWVESYGASSQGKTFNQSEWTYMVDGNRLARACIKGIADPNPACTRWY